MLKIALLDCAINESRKKKRGGGIGVRAFPPLSLSPPSERLEQAMKNVAVLTEDGAFALFFRPHPGGFDSSRAPIPRNLPSKAKKNANTRGSARGELGAAGIDLCINITSRFAVALTEIRTRRILREKVDCKQSKQACSYRFFLLGIHICQAWEQQQVLQHFGAKLADLTGGYCSI